jgi:hypothetical protein
MTERDDGDVMLKRWMMLTVAGIGLAACAGGGPEGEPPALNYDYVEGTEVAPPSDVPPPVPVPLAGVAGMEPPVQKKWKSAAAKTADAIKRSKRTALDCTFEGSIMTCPFENGNRTQVTLDGPSAPKATDSNGTIFYLEAGEGTPEVIFGNPQWFMAEVTGGGTGTESWKSKRDRANNRKTPGTRLVISVKAYKPGESTPMSVATGNRIYLYDLHVPSCKANDEAKKCNLPYHPVVQHTYDGDQPNIKPSSVTRRQAPAVANTRYAYQGAAEFLPNEWSAYNDGVNTYVLPPARLSSRPVPMFPKGGPSNFHVDAVTKQYVIRGLPGEVVFKRGSATMTVRKEQ